jgi:hypothetical protein
MRRTSCCAALPPPPQDVPYLLIEPPGGGVAAARLGRSPITEQPAEITRRLALHRQLEQPLQDAAARVLQASWRQWAAWRREDREAKVAGGVAPGAAAAGALPTAGAGDAAPA